MLKNSTGKRGVFLQETQYQIEGCPKRITLALVADLHDRPFDRVLSSLKAHRPQVICIAGDLIHGDVDPTLAVKLSASPTAIPFLRECVALAPTYYSLGNHEWSLGEKDFSFLKEMGVHVLHNTWEPLTDGVWIGGLSSARVSSVSANGLILHSPNKYPAKWKRYLPGGHRRTPPLFPESAWLQDFCAQDGFKILLCHHPEYWEDQEPYLKEKPIQLVLAGHAHGGQIRFYDPFTRQWRGVFSPEQGFFPKWTAGVHEGACGKMILSRGLANTGGPVPRLFNPKELVYVDLSPYAQTNQQNR